MTLAQYSKNHYISNQPFMENSKIYYIIDPDRYHINCRGKLTHIPIVANLLTAPSTVVKNDWDEELPLIVILWDNLNFHTGLIIPSFKTDSLLDI